MSDPNPQIAKLITFSEGIRLADLENIELDLEIASNCFERIISANISPMRPSFLHSDMEGDYEVWPYFVTGSITYRRAFTSGARESVSWEELTSVLTPEQKVLHGRFFDNASCHIAHPVNAQEQHGVTIYVSYDENDKLRRGSFGRMGSTASSFSVAEIAAVRALIEDIRSKYIRAEKRLCEAAIAYKLFQMSDSEVDALPPGYPPDYIHSDSFRKRRTWPVAK